MAHLPGPHPGTCFTTAKQQVRSQPSSQECLDFLRFQLFRPKRITCFLFFSFFSFGNSFTSHFLTGHITLIYKPNSPEWEEVSNKADAPASGCFFSFPCNILRKCFAWPSWRCKSSLCWAKLMSPTPQGLRALLSQGPHLINSTELASTAMHFQLG